MSGRNLAIISISILVIPLSALAQPPSPRPPIVIASDSEFTLENGVVRGSGTPNDPYIIAGWEIDAGSGTGIVIRGVGAYVIVEDCWIQGGPKGTGVSVSLAPNVIVRRCRFENLGTGVFIYQSPGVVMEGNEFIDCWTGIDGNQSGGLQIRGNEFHRAKKRGVFLWRARASVVEGNKFWGCGAGIYLDSCNQFTVKGNFLKECGWGIYLWDSHSGSVTLNALVGCARGIGLYHTSAYNYLYHNSFVDCALPAFDDSSGENRWFAPYPQGGNFWGIELQDNMAGPDQREKGSDGIGDEPVKIPETGVDRYPLVSPPPGVPQFDEGGEG